MSRFDDLASLFVVPDEPGNVTFRQGVILTWNTSTGENTIQAGGAVHTNVPTMASSEEVGQLAAGDVVGMLVVTWGGTSMYFVVGRITVPGTPVAASALLLRTQAASVGGTESTSSASYGDLSTAGPAVTVTVGPTGRVLVTSTCTFNYGATNSDAGGVMSFEVSGASTVGPSDQLGPQSHLQDSNGTTTVIDRKSVTKLMSGLTPGVNIFTSKYRATVGGVACNFSTRDIVVVPL